MKLLLTLSLVGNMAFLLKVLKTEGTCRQLELTKEIAWSPAPSIARKTEETNISFRSLFKERSPASYETESCEHFWLSLQQTEWSKDDPLTALSFPFPKGNCQNLPPSLNALHSEALAKCTKPSSSEAQSYDCMQLLKKYRNHLVHLQTEGIPLSEISDPKTLQRKLMALFESVDGTSASGDKMIEIGSRLLELNPGDLRAVQVAIRGVDSIPKNAPEEVWLKSERLLNDLERLNPNDPDLDDYRLWIKSRGMQSPLLAKEARDYIQQHPSSGLGYYYLAGMEWEAKNEAASKTYLKEAVRREPREKRYIRSLKSAEKSEATFEYLTYFDVDLEGFGE